MHCTLNLSMLSSHRCSLGNVLGLRIDFFHKLATFKTFAVMAYSETMIVEPEIFVEGAEAELAVQSPAPNGTLAHGPDAKVVDIPNTAEEVNMDFAVQSPGLDDTIAHTGSPEQQVADAPNHVNGTAPQDIWFFPTEIMDDLKDTVVPEAFIAEALACAWEYARCVIPHFTNWPRYVAFTRVLVIAIVVEFRGSTADIIASDKVLGYDVEELINTLFAGTAGRDEMARELRSWLLITGDKTSSRRTSELFHRYVNSLAHSPRDWFRLRDCDALARFTIAAAWACNDIDDMWLTEDEFEILTELCDTCKSLASFGIPLG